MFSFSVAVVSADERREALQSSATSGNSAWQQRQSPSRRQGLRYTCTVRSGEMLPLQLARPVRCSPIYPNIREIAIAT